MQYCWNDLTLCWPFLNLLQGAFLRGDDFIDDIGYFANGLEFDALVGQFDLQFILGLQPHGKPHKTGAYSHSLAINAYATAHIVESSSACANTVLVASSCKSGG